MIIKVESTVPCRLDRYLRRLYPKLTHGLLEKAFRLKQIKVNSIRAQGNLRVIQNDEIFVEDRLNLDPYTNAVIRYSESVIKLAQKISTNYLIYENEWFIAINKPSGLPTQGGSKISLSINDALNYLNQRGNDLKLVHRLDKDTSGVLLIAKDYDASNRLAQAFRDKKIKKIYLAVVVGRPENNVGTISAVMHKQRGVAYERVVQDPDNGKLAVTHYKLLQSLDNGLSLIEFTPVTGRMHQLRFHAQLLGCPIVGDEKYGNIGAYQCQHMLLHAKTISLPKEIFGEEIVIQAELPSYFLRGTVRVDQ